MNLPQFSLSLSIPHTHSLFPPVVTSAWVCFIKPALCLSLAISPQVNGALLKLTTPEDIQALQVKGMIYDFSLVITFSRAAFTVPVRYKNTIH